MIRRLLLALTLLVGQSATAQTLTPNPDMGTYTPRSATYASGTTPNVLGDGSNSAGGVPPVFSTHPEPADPAPAVPTGYIVSSGVSFCLTTNGVVGQPDGLCNNKKARYNADSSHFLPDDPIRYYGQPGASHCHEFFGNRSTNAYSTWASARLRSGNSTGSGGPALGVMYWEPCWLKTIGGLVYAMPATGNTIYYDEEVPAGTPIVNRMQRLHLQHSVIVGVNMDDPDDAGVKAEIAAANAQAGTAGRYQYRGNGFTGYGCVPPGQSGPTTVKGGGTHTRSFVLADGTDPWEGRCTAGSKIYAETDAPPCGDGWNTMAPNGHDNWRHEVFDTVTNQLVCPNGWFRFPRFQLKTFHETQGWPDYSGWALASDAHMAARLAALGTPRTVLPGSSFHADWKNGWHKGSLWRWLSFCMGIPTPAANDNVPPLAANDNPVPHGCDYSTIDANARLITDSPSPDGKRIPQVNTRPTVNSNNPSELFLVQTARRAQHNMRGQ